MELVSVETALVKAHKYLVNDVATPYFIVVDDSAAYSEITAGLGSLAQIRVSKYCANDDAHPDTGALYEALSNVVENTLILGFGESTSLSGNENTISMFKDLVISAKVIFLCRGIRAAVKKICAEDPKFDGRKVCFLGQGSSTYEIIKFPASLRMVAINGYKDLLFRLENGVDGVLYVKTSLKLHNTWEINSAYEAILQREPTFGIPQSCLTDDLWSEYLADRNMDGFSLTHWRTFLKLKLGYTDDVYLKYVIDTSVSYDVYKKQLVYALLDYEVEDGDFWKMYSSRKVLLKDVKDIDIAEYTAETKVKDEKRMYYLTDNTSVERQAIIESLNGMSVIPDNVIKIYPALHEYLKDYIFTDGKGDLLTDYFSDYKRLKLTNRITPEFHELVCNLAIDGERPYNSLRTRGEILDSLSKTNTALFWIDALGVEYLGYIQSRANSLGLKITVHVVRANLPTITSLNSDFYAAWEGEKTQTKDLDKIKHEGEHDFNYQTVKVPVHLSEELSIIDDVLEWAKMKLTGKSSEKLLIVSDHGTSRLAVINEQENKWEMATKGQHSGRCCPCSDADVRSEYATKENGFWVLANYDRFKGGRKASVEVHGGATLEEVVIPIIEVELYDSKIDIRNTTLVTTASYRKNAEIILFSKSLLESVSIKVEGKHYPAEAIGSNKHKVVLSDVKRAGKYTADVFEGDNLIGQVEFEVQRESGRAIDTDWF